MTWIRRGGRHAALVWLLLLLVGLVLIAATACGETESAEQEDERPAATTTETVEEEPPPEPQEPQEAVDDEPDEPRGDELEATLVGIVDGDTIRVRSGGFDDTVRLLGIDTPETRHPGEPVQCFGPQASEQAKRLMPLGEKVTLVTDPSQDRRDRYDRLLAYVYRGDSSGPDSVNRLMVKGGFAKVYVFDESSPFRYRDAFFRTQSRAPSDDKGLWGPPCNGNTDQPDPSVAPEPEPEPEPPPLPDPPPEPDPAPPSGGNCDPNYTGGCVPPYPPDVNCADVVGPLQVVGSDPHGLDGDGDGVACE